MATINWKEIINRAFPKLINEGFEIVGQPTERYNCIAYAAGDTSNVWDNYEDEYEDNYWPAHATRSDHIESLKEVFAGLGFEEHDDSSSEDNYETVALYEERGAWKHAAAQMPNGRCVEA